jgi:hypothetical protein
MEELTMRAEQMLDLIEQMKAMNARLEALCTGKCERCPLKSECLGDAQFDLGRDYDIEKCADYLDYYDKVKAEEAKEAFIADMESEQERRFIESWEEANRWAGVDPNWMNVRRHI